MVAPLERSLTDLIGFLPNSCQADVLACENNHADVMDAASRMNCQCCSLGTSIANTEYPMSYDDSPKDQGRSPYPPVMNSMRTPLDRPIQPIVFIGEGPGRSERMNCECFVGASGQLIKGDACLPRGAGIPEQWCYWTNLVRCRPADEIVNPRTGKKSLKDHKPSAQQIESCFPLLLKTLHCLPNMRYIILLGKVAAAYCLGLKKTFPILDHIGYGIPMRVCGKRVTAVVMAHPSYLCRNMDDTKTRSRNLNVLRNLKHAVYTQAQEIHYTPLPKDMFLKREMPACYDTDKK